MRAAERDDARARERVVREQAAERQASLAAELAEEERRRAAAVARNEVGERLIGIILDDEGASAAAAGAPNVGPRCAWLYAGSHNLSGAAWGKFEAATAEAATATDAMSDDDGEEEEMSDADGEEEFVLMSYEIGVLLVPPRPRRFALPWRSPALK